ncbi:MAG: hypothetical protein K2G93_03445 [Rikenella sp.]|nr:hypothetical protein [Rikenella sp.]
MWNVGYNGYSWASSASENNGYFLSLSYNGIYPNSSGYRAYGRQTRCLQE